jgi:predicted ATPase
MISNVRIKNFKAFEEQEFDLPDRIILAGPNNSGKSTLLQAITTWHLAISKWCDKVKSESTIGKKANKRERPGIPLTRKDFTALPLREMNLLWRNRDTALSRGELSPDTKPGQPKLIEIALGGMDNGTAWEYTVHLRYSNQELVYFTVLDKENKPVNEVPLLLEAINVLHVPPFSGIGAEETKYDLGYQNLLIGQGKPGDILRNILLEIYLNKDNSHWKSIVVAIDDLFSCTLLDPQYSPGSPFILCEYSTHAAQGKPVKLDIASAGTGFHQVLMLLGFLFARPSSVILMDEPDAHLHIILQRQIYDKLRSLCREKSSQIIIATHSEILLQDTSPLNIYSFYGSPHILKFDAQRDQVREALKRLTTLDIIAVDHYTGILYTESENDIKILREFARILEHPLYHFLNSPFFLPLQGRNPAEAKAHFFALQAIKSEIRGAVLLDGDNRNLPDHDLLAENLRILRWQRYEIENYLLVPTALDRFLNKYQPQIELFLNKHIQDEWPPAVIRDPLGKHAFLENTPASKEILPQLFYAIQYKIAKSEYYQIASVFVKDEIHKDIVTVLDRIHEVIR